MQESLAVLGGKAEPERLCLVIPGHTAGLKNGLPGRRATCVSHVCLLKDPDVTEPPLSPFYPCCPAASTTVGMQQLKSTETSAMGSPPVDLWALW